MLECERAARTLGVMAARSLAMSSVHAPSSDTSSGTNLSREPTHACFN